MDRVGDLIRFYDLLHRLEVKSGGKKLLSNCDGYLSWPKRGVYFFMEEGETRSDSGEGPRVVRVGTHAITSKSRTGLWGRLSQHRGTKGKGGNHRGSIFRKLIGYSILGKHQDCLTWGEESSASSGIRHAEEHIEQEVSAIVGKMPFLVVGIDDPPGPKSLRAVIETNSIGLLSNHEKTPLDPPSSDWLGHRCRREKVRVSGLWNQRDTDRDYDPGFLDVFESLVEKMGTIQ